MMEAAYRRARRPPLDGFSGQATRWALKCKCLSIHSSMGRSSSPGTSTKTDTSPIITILAPGNFSTTAFATFPGDLPQGTITTTFCIGHQGEGNKGRTMIFLIIDFITPATPLNIPIQILKIRKFFKLTCVSGR